MHERLITTTQNELECEEAHIVHTFSITTFLEENQNQLENHAVREHKKWRPSNIIITTSQSKVYLLF